MDKPPITLAVAEWIRVTCQQRGITETQLADGSGIARVTLRRRLAGQPFRFDEIEGVARFLGVKVSDITAAAEADAA